MWKEGFLERKQVKLLSCNSTESWRNWSGAAVIAGSAEDSGQEGAGLVARPSVGAVGGTGLPSPGAGKGISV